MRLLRFVVGFTACVALVGGQGRSRLRKKTERAAERSIPLRSHNVTVQMPTLIYSSAMKRHDTARFVERAFQMGFRGVDTAADEGTRYNDSGVGEGLRRVFGGKKRDLEKRRSEFYVQLKVHHVDAPEREERNKGGAVKKKNGAAAVASRKLNEEDRQLTVEDGARRFAESFDRSLANLGLDYVDVLLLRGPSSQAMKKKKLLPVDVGAWRAAQAIFAEGRARSLGACNFGPALLDELEDLAKRWKGARLRVVQTTRVHAQRFNYALADRDHAKKRGLALQVSRWLTTNREAMALGGPVRKLASLHNTSPELILLRFALQLRLFPVVGTTSVQHIDEDLKVYDLALTDADVAAIARAPLAKLPGRASPHRAKHKVRQRDTSNVAFGPNHQAD